MADRYAHVDRGTDIRGMRWDVGTEGANVIVHVDIRSGVLKFDGEGRDQFIKAFAEAERRAEAHQAVSGDG